MEYKLIKTEYLESVSGGDKGILKEIVNLFSSQAIEITAEMKTLLAEGNYPSLGMLAHKAKSSVAIMGMNDLADMLKTFEIEGKEGKNTETYSLYIGRFEKESAEAVIELEKFINNL